MDTRKQIFEEKLNQKPLESKKALYALLAGLCVLTTFTISSFLILRHAEVAKEIVELANLVVLFFGATVTTLITGQAAMDWKAMSALQHLDEDQKQDTQLASNQPISAPIQEADVYISGQRSPKDFLNHSLSL